MPAYRSKTSTSGRNMAGARALWRAIVEMLTGGGMSAERAKEISDVLLP